LTVTDKHRVDGYPDILWKVDMCWNCLIPFPTIQIQ